MQVTLSSTDLENLARAIHLLVSPLDYGHVDEWRSAVNAQLKELLVADSAGFLLPVSEGLMLYSEEHDPKELASYPEIVAPPVTDGTPMWEEMVRTRVGTLADMYGQDYDRYLGSEYYNDYAGANGAHDTLYAAMPLWGVDASSMAGLHFWHAQPDGRLFGDREVALLRALFPAFRAGVEAQVRWGGHRSDLLGALEAIGHAVLVCELTGKLLHQTRALSVILETDPGAEGIRAEMLAAGKAVGCSAMGQPGECRAPSNPLVREIRTSADAYLLRSSLYRVPDRGGVPVVLVSLERRSPAQRPESELREAYGLTRTEVTVARLIGKGRSNAQIATELFISPHTARRHTERVLYKMNVRSRAEVAATLHR